MNTCGASAGKSATSMSTRRGASRPPRLVAPVVQQSFGVRTEHLALASRLVRRAFGGPARGLQDGAGQAADAPKRDRTRSARGQRPDEVRWGASDGQQDHLQGADRRRGRLARDRSRAGHGAGRGRRPRVRLQTAAAAPAAAQCNCNQHTTSTVTVTTIPTTTTTTSSDQRGDESERHPAGQVAGRRPEPGQQRGKRFRRHPDPGPGDRRWRRRSLGHLARLGHRGEPRRRRRRGARSLRGRAHPDREGGDPGLLLRRQGRPAPGLAGARPTASIAEGYEGEVYRCIAGSHMQVTIAQWREQVSFEGGQTLACQKGEAL